MAGYRQQPDPGGASDYPCAYLQEFQHRRHRHAERWADYAGTRNTLAAMDDIGAVFLDKSRALITSDYLPKIERCLDRLSDADIWWRHNEASNSIGNLILHLCGNVTMWIIGGVGALPFERHRQREFDERTQIAGEELRTRLRMVVRQADDVLSAVAEDDLLRR